jgi:hypothetical protein
MIADIDQPTAVVGDPLVAMTVHQSVDMDRGPLTSATMVADPVTMIVSIKDMFGQQTTLVMGTGATVGDLKLKLHCAGGPPVDAQRLLWNRDTLEDEEDVLTSHGVGNGATIHLALQDQGEGAARRKARESARALLHAQQTEKARLAEWNRKAKAGTEQRRRAGQQQQPPPQPQPPPQQQQQQPQQQQQQHHHHQQQYHHHHQQQQHHQQEKPGPEKHLQAHLLASAGSQQPAAPRRAHSSRGSAKQADEDLDCVAKCCAQCCVAFCCGILEGSSHHHHHNIR